MDIMQLSSCLVNQIMVYIYNGFPFNCTMMDQVSDSIMALMLVFSWAPRCSTWGFRYLDLLCGSFVFSLLCVLCFCARLFICALWSPAGKGLTSWLLFVVYDCEFVTFPLVSWVGVVLDCIDS